MSSKLGEILLNLGLVRKSDIEEALTLQRKGEEDRKLGEILTDFFLREEDLNRALSMQKGGFSPESSVDIVSRIMSHRLEQKDIRDILASIGPRVPAMFLEKISDVLEKVVTFLDISNRLSDITSLESVLESMIEMVCEALRADRGTLFLNEKETGELFSRIAGGGTVSEIRFPNAKGIAGHVFTTGETLNIKDAYADPRFNREIDKETGYRTRNILCAPVRTRDEEVIGVIQLLNKKEGDFTDNDLTLLENITLQASAALQNAQLFEQVRKAAEEETRLLEVATAISRELHLHPLLIKIMETTTDMLDADRSTLFMHDEKTNELWSTVAQGTESREIRFPSHLGIAGTVFATGETINIPEAYEDPRFNREVDRKTGYKTKSILCMPVINKQGVTIGVTQVLNKRGGPFTSIDERRLGAFSAQASIAIENAKLFDEVLNMKNYNESMLESMSNGVITLDAENRIVKCNGATARILNERSESITGISVHECFTDVNSWVIESINRVAESGKPDVTVDAELFLTSNKSVSINLTVVPLAGVKQEPLGTMLVMEDITEEKRIKGTMARYMTKEVAEKLLESGEAILGGQEQVATVLFSDIRRFTAISEKLGAGETVSLLNDYFTLMVDIIFDYSGILDKYIGDAILAVFGAPFTSGEDADNAVRTAVDMMRALAELNRKLRTDGKDSIDIGIGINTDRVISGNIGSLKRMDYTVIGDGVNLASRLEGANKYFGTNILISEFTFTQLKGNYRTRPVDRIVVKGKAEPVSVYEVFDYKDGKTFEGLNEVTEMYGEGLELYRVRRWKDALSMFERALSLNAGDGPSGIYAQRCRHFIQYPPDEAWDGVWVMKGK